MMSGYVDKSLKEKAVICTPVDSEENHKISPSGQNVAWSRLRPRHVHVQVWCTVIYTILLCLVV